MLINACASFDSSRGQLAPPSSVPSVSSNTTSNKSEPTPDIESKENTQVSEQISNTQESGIKQASTASKAKLQPSPEHTSTTPASNSDNEALTAPPYLISQIFDETVEPKEKFFVSGLLSSPDEDLFSSFALNNKLIDSASAEHNKQQNRNYEQYGFITPTDELEQKVNQELQLLRDRPSHNPDQGDLLDDIRKHFTLDLTLDNKRIQSQLRWYVNNPNYLDRTFKRSSRYLHHVVQEVKKRKLPMELALLPFVESAYDPFAYSHGRASGLWQFIPGTGKIYGLHQNWWYDGRRDVLASTQGALEYLSYLSRRFDGNWLHALASYNSGSGRVSKAIKRNKKLGKPQDFWSLKLPRETRAYVPKLLALAKIVKSPEKYNIQFPKIADKPYFETVQTGGQIDLAQAATLAGIDIKEIYKLNPGFNQWASAPMGPHRLLVPIESAKQFKAALTELPPEKRLNWTRYSIKRGDSLIRIAKKFNTTPALIKQVNQLRSNTIREKQKLLIPVASEGKAYYNLSQHNRLKRKQDKISGSQGSKKLRYKVRSGDTMWDISRAHKVGVRSLAKWNGMAPTDPIKPGQELIIWSLKDVGKASMPLPSFRDKRQMIRKIGYRVRKGDSLARIASKFSVTINDLVSWNKLNKKKYLQPGQKLTIYVDITAT
ncbi:MULTISPECIES: LysM peptidoglycan-binding domain-containing protein [unclassified Oleiphilus]|nr:MULTISPECIES: LysM peptidoglycan-binding domain-containing protein [unclassified Oleiphilus]